ncbi:MAG: tetratricopeptide repeat protein [Bacteroidota bacterium]
MPKKLTAHEKTVRAVARLFKRKLADYMQGSLLDGALRLWHDFAATTDLGRTRKPATWAAALLYTFDRLQISGLTQQEVAEHFKVSAITVSTKHRDMAHALDLTVLDARYLPEITRAAARRSMGAAMDGLPLLEAPVHLWQLPFSPAAHNASWNAQELVYDGWEALRINLDRAEQCFTRALGIDPFLADAYNGLAKVAEADDDLVRAEALYRKAYGIARETLGTESPKAYYWWGELETRPYMRARQGIGWICWQQGRYDEALEQYNALLHLNPNDNQGVRYLIPPLTQLTGDLDAALDAYDRYHTAYPDDRGDPHLTFSYGLALFEADRTEDALRQWYRAFFDNIYLAPLLTRQSVPQVALWHSTSDGWRDHAELYLELFGDLWKNAPDARRTVKLLWRDPAVKVEVSMWMKLGQELHALSESARQSPDFRERWVPLIHRQRDIEQEPLRPIVIDRLTDA